MHLSSLFLNTVIVWFLGSTVFKRSFSWFKIVKASGVFALVWLPVTATAYILTPSYFDHVEVHMANLAAYLKQGHELYPSFDDPHRYALLYGPWPTLFNSLIMGFQPLSIQASKAMGLLNLFLSLASFWFVILKSNLKPRTLIFGIFCICLLGFDDFSYVNRPDSFLITYVLSSLFLIANIESKIATFGFSGILVGLTVASKVHGFIYFLPLLAFCYEYKKEKWSWNYCALAVFLALLFSFAPFFHPLISFENFRVWLKTTAQHGLEFRLFTDNISMTCVYVAGLWFTGFHKILPKTFWTLVSSMVLTSIFGSLQGAGTHHLIPYLGPCIYFLSLAYSQNNVSHRAQVYLAAMAICLSYDAFISQKAIIKYFESVPQREREFADLKEFRKGFSGIAEIGYGESPQIEMSNFKPYFVAGGDSLLVEYDSLMDSSTSGLIIPQSTITFLQSCAIPYIIGPKDSKLWSIQSIWGRRVFSENWGKAFDASYILVAASRYYSAYKCRN